MRTSIKAAIIAKKLLEVSGESTDPGLLYLQDNAKAYWDFTLQAGADGSTMTLADDQTTNNRDLDNSSPAAAPKVDEIQIGDEIFKTLQTRTSLAADVMVLGTASHANDMFSTDYEIDIAFTLEEGQEASFTYLLGLVNGTNRVQLRLNTSGGVFGQLAYIHYANGQQAAISKDLVFPAGAVGLTVINVKMDFTNDIIQMGVNGDYSGFTEALPISAVTAPSGFTAGTVKLAIGGNNNAGTVDAVDSGYKNILRCAVTPIKTVQQRLDVLNYFSNP